MEPMKPMAPMPPMKPMERLSSPDGAWWPQGLTNPSSTGSQGTLRYAFFSTHRRLVVDLDGDVRQYDTGDHVINGVSQPGQGGAVMDAPKFTSQHGDVDLAKLRFVKS